MYWHIDTDIISLAIIAIMLLDSRAKLDKSKLRDKLFFCCMITSLAATCLDIADSAVMEATVSPILFHLITSLYFASIIFPLLAWYCYSNSIIFGSRRRALRHSFILAAVIAAIYLIFIISNLWTGALYSLDSAGAYSRGPLFIIPVMLYVLLTLIIAALVVINRKHIRKKQMRVYLIIVPLLDGIGVLLQLSIPGWLMIMPANSLALLMAYIFIQNQSNLSRLSSLTIAADTDRLTGLLNRAAGERAVNAWLGANKDVSCAMLIIDIDDLKAINDSFGHPAGDDAIAHMSAILKSSFRSTDIVTRIGGDEFAVLLPLVGSSAVLRRIISEFLNKFSEAAVSPSCSFPLRCSVGGVLCRQEQPSASSLYRQADIALYQAKRSGKFCYAIYDGNMEQPGKNS